MTVDPKAVTRREALAVMAGLTAVALVGGDTTEGGATMSQTNGVPLA